ncbi:MAG: F0F1 ATP synthase subunit A [Pirellula sp.]
MASDILHIKDGYFFEVPRMLWRSTRTKASDFPSWFVRLDSEFQSAEADTIITGLTELGVNPAEMTGLKERWQEWQHADHKNAGWPLDAYLEKQGAELKAVASKWARENEPAATDAYQAYLAENQNPAYDWFVQVLKSPEKLAGWNKLKAKINGEEFLQAHLTDSANWSEAKIAQYNSTLHGKMLIPQPFGTPRNAYEPESGFCISRYMIIELVVALLAIAIFGWLAKRIASGSAPKGKRWNSLEGLVQWVRNDVVVPAMGEEDAKKFMPFLWTLFFFLLGCNLTGMIPWLGSPTAAWGTTLALAAIVFAIGLTMGLRTFGVVGFLKNICPDLGLPWYLAFWIVPLLWLIEAFSLIVKHIVLSVRLVMNMGAGHLVLLGIMGIGISVSAAAMSLPMWGSVAVISVLGTTILSFLELFVACLQAYLFTFLAAMFIGSSMHHH